MSERVFLDATPVGDNVTGDAGSATVILQPDGKLRRTKVVEGSVFAGIYTRWSCPDEVYDPLDKRWKPENE